MTFTKRSSSSLRNTTIWICLALLAITEVMSVPYDPNTCNRNFYGKCAYACPEGFQTISGSKCFKLPCNCVKVLPCGKCTQCSPGFFNHFETGVCFQVCPDGLKVFNNKDCVPLDYVSEEGGESPSSASTSEIDVQVCYRVN